MQGFQLLFTLFFAISTCFSQDHHDHHHTAPNGGMLIPLGDHFANVELLFDPESGKVRIWLLDGCAENYIRSSMPSVDLVVRRKEVQPDVTPAQQDRVVRIKLAAIANRLTGETVGNTSEFAAIIDSMRGVLQFHGFLERIEIRSEEFLKVPVQWPE